MQIRSIQKLLEAFECKFEQLERDSKDSKANAHLLKGIWSIQVQIQAFQKEFNAFDCKFESFKRDSKRSNANDNHSKKFKAF